MTLTPVAKAPRIDQTILSKQAHLPGPCATILLPATHPGASEAGKVTMLRSLAHSVSPDSDPPWLARVEKLLRANGWAGGGPGLAIFARDEVIDLYEASIEYPRISTGPYSFLLPLLREVTSPQRFLILGLNRKRLRLFEYNAGLCRERDLPDDVPAGVEEVHEPPNAYPEGVSLETERERRTVRIEQFFLRVDATLAHHTAKKRVLLFGLPEEIAAFRRVGRRLKLFSSEVALGLSDLPLSVIAQLGGSCAQREQIAASHAALHRINEHPDRSQVTADLALILEAARLGRVDTLCVADGTGEMADLTNAAVIETLRHSGVTVPVANQTTALLRF